ncbi:ATP-binding protein [[Brevibacterium] frigoritolerans]|nr:ATP-binding protein [Peribacillus frigoritolerans]
MAFAEKFVVAKADFTPERRLYGSEGKAVAIYTELMKNLSIATVPDGGALPTILDKWIGEVQALVVQEKEYGSVEFDNPQFVKDVEKEITAVVSKMDELTGGYDFARILNLYFKGFIEDNSELQRRAMRWLRGEYGTKTEAKADLGVRDIINDNNYYDYIKVLSQFVKQIGYSGLVVNLDEAINLYKITHPQTRDKNYETILKIYNDTLQGNVEGLYISLGGTPEFLEDERRGLFSYGALKRRLQSNPHETQEHRDLSQPVIKLTPLKHDDTFVLLRNLVTSMRNILVMQLL